MPDQDPIDEFIALPRDQQMSTLQALSPEKQNKLLETVKQRRSQSRPNPTPTATIGPAPKVGFLDNVERDLRHGGTRTVVGRTLGKMQGRGDKGYSGLEAGVSKETADFMGSPELGAVETAKGLAKIKDQPVRGTIDTVKGLAHMLEIPSMVMGGPGSKVAAEASASAINKAIEALPTATRGAKRLNEVEQAAADLPVEFQRTYEHLDAIRKLGDAGASVPKPLKILIKSLKKNEPMTYEQARRIYEVLGNLSAKQKMSVSPNMARLVTAARQAMKQDIGDTAEMVGKAAEYYGGMRDYARAMKAARIKNAITSALTSKAVQTGIGVAGGGAAAYGVAKAIGKEF